MRCYSKYIIVLLLFFLSNSCIKENFRNCPNWGKYRVGFYTKSNIEYSSINYVTINYSCADTMNRQILKKYNSVSDSLLTYPTELIRLFPGNYKFSVLLSTEEVTINNLIKIQNGHPYLYATSNNEIIKSPLNKVGFIFNLANSMIAVKCSLDSTFNNCTICKVELSPPQELYALLNISNGICCYEKQTTDYFDNAIFDNKENEWIYYCNPMVSGNNLIFKITILDKVANIHKILFCKVFLESGLEQAKVSRFYLNVSPHSIDYVSSTITDWIDYTHYQDIVL